MGRKSRNKKERQQESRPELPKTEQSSAAFPFLKLVVLFAVLVVVFEVFAEFIFDLMPLQLATSVVTTKLFLFSGLDVASNGILMTLPNAQWEIVRECTGIRAQVVFVAFVIAYPASIKAKTLAVSAGVPFLFVVNIIRLLALGWLTYFNPALAEYCHDFVWQMGFLFLVIGMWLAWIEWVVNCEKQPAVSA